MKYIRSVLFALLGLWCIITGIQLYNSNIGELYPCKEYGGDAFTGIQNAEVQTGGLVRLQSVILSHGIGSILIFGGIAFIICAIPTSLKKRED